MSKLWFINQSLGIGGAETFNTQLINYLRQHDFDVRCFVTNRIFSENLGSDTQIIPVVLDIIGNWKGLFKALFLFPLGIVYYMYLVVRSKLESVEIIYMSGFVEKILITPLARLLNIRVVWIEFGPLATIFSKFFGLPRLLYKLVKDLPNTIIVPSRHTFDDLHYLSNKIIIIPCARDITIKPKKVKQNIVTCVSRLEKGKGQDLLISAWTKVLKVIPDAQLWIIGTGYQYFDLPLDKSIKLKGWVKDALIEINNSKVCVFPSVWPLEGFGLVMLEAMALNKPVVAFDVGPAREIINSKNGILVPSGNLKSLANAIIAQLQKPIATGREDYLHRFTFEILGPKYEQAYRGNS